MLVVMRQYAKPEEIQGVVRAIEARGFKAHPIPGAQRTAIGITGNRGAVDRPVFEGLPGVLERVRAYRARFGDYWQPAPLLERLVAEGRALYND